MARVLFALLLFAASAPADDGRPAAVAPERVRGAVFAGRDAEFRVRPAAAGRLGWRLAAGGRTLAAGEALAQAGVAVPIRFTAPPLVDGAALQARLTVTANAAWERDVWILPADPFAGRAEWLKSLQITLFDPAGRTTKALAALNVPFAEVANPAALPDIAGGVVVCGEGASFRENPDAPAALAGLAARGVPVLCLAPADGELLIPGLAGPADGQAELTLRRDAVRHFDKRLDPADFGPPARPAAWPWAEARFAGKGRWLYCGLPLAATWDDDPAPRYLFAAILEQLSDAPRTDR